MRRVLPEFSRIDRIEDRAALRAYERLVANWLEWRILTPVEAHALRQRILQRLAELEEPVGAA